MNGAHAAVSLPNGSILSIASAMGGSEYHELMASWFDLCMGTHVDHTNTSELTARVEEVFPRASCGYRTGVVQSWHDFWTGRRLP